MSLILSKGKEYLDAIEESREWLAINHRQIFNDADGYELEQCHLATLIVDLNVGDFYQIQDLSRLDYKRLCWALRLIEVVALGQIGELRRYCREDGRVVNWRSRL